MKNLLVVAAMTMTFNVMANDVDTADSLFAERGANVANAQRAADLYGQLAAAAADKGEKAALMVKQSAATYYVGTKAKDDDTKMEIHEDGYEQAEAAINLLKGTDDFEEEETLAKSYFYYGANLGKWGEAKGVVASLFKVDDLKAAMRAIEDLGYEDVEEYGADRILGRLYFKVPKLFGGDKEVSEKKLRNAVQNTLSEDGTVSVHGLNNLYLAETLFERGGSSRKKEACTLLANFVKQDSETLLETRIPETKEEIAEAKTMMKKENCK